jgi:hypothetical protein
MPNLKTVGKCLLHIGVTSFAKLMETCSSHIEVGKSKAEGDARAALCELEDGLRVETTWFLFAPIK